jgi:hypothetical protein
MKEGIVAVERPVLIRTMGRLRQPVCPVLTTLCSRELLRIPQASHDLEQTRRRPFAGPSVLHSEPYNPGDDNDSPQDDYMAPGHVEGDDKGGVWYVVR